MILRMKHWHAAAIAIALFSYGCSRFLAESIQAWVWVSTTRLTGTAGGAATTGDMITGLSMQRTP